MINDPGATRRVVDAINRLDAHLPIFVRTQYLGQAEDILELGASDVVAGEVEGGLEVLARVLRELEVPHNVLESEVNRARRATQRSARTFVTPRVDLARHAGLAELKVESVQVVEGSQAAHGTPRGLGLGQNTGALIVALRRGDDLITAGLADQNLQPDDVVYLIGEHGSVIDAVQLLGRPT